VRGNLRGLFALRLNGRSRGHQCRGKANLKILVYPNRIEPQTTELTQLVLNQALTEGVRQTTGFLESLLELVGLDWAVPVYRDLYSRHRKVCSLSNAKGEHLVNLVDFASLGPLSRIAKVQWSLV
jgi:hypothetical protein